MNASGEAFPLRGGIRVLSMVVPLVMLAFGAVGTIGVYGSGDVGAKAFFTLWMIGVAVQWWWANFQMPQRIEASETGLRFVARSRAIDLPWPAFRSVGSPWHDLGNQMLVWKGEGRTLRTWNAYEGMHRLLRTIEERAPQAKIRL